MAEKEDTKGKRDPFAVTGEELAALLSAQTAPKRLDGWLLDTFGGLSPLVCRELAFRLTGDLDTDLSALSAEEKTALAARLLAAFALVLLVLLTFSAAPSTSRHCCVCPAPPRAPGSLRTGTRRGSCRPPPASSATRCSGYSSCSPTACSPSCH